MSDLLQLLLLLTAIVVLAKAAGASCVRLGQPAVFGEITMGLILGPTLLDMLQWGIFAENSQHFGRLIGDLAQIGVILLMFVAGMETDLLEMRRVGKTAFWAAVGGVVLPLGFGTLASSYFGHAPVWEGIFIGTILTATSVSISAQTLMELKALRTREGTTILGAAVIDDVLGIILLGLVTALSVTEAAGDAGVNGFWEVAWILIRMTAYFVVLWLIGRKYLEKWCKWVSLVPASQALLAFVLVVAFLYAWAAEFFAHLAAITGSYMAGVLFAQTRYKAEIDRDIHPLTYSFFVPVFFVSIGLAANGRELGNEIGFLLTIVVLAILTKAVGCFIGARATGFNNFESLRVGVGMISRGEVGLIIAGVGLTRGIIKQDVFSIMVIMVLVTTMITPILLRYVFPRVREVPAVVFESIGDLEDKEEEKELLAKSGTEDKQKPRITHL